MLGEAGLEGRQLKGSAQRWWLGHGIGRVGGQKAGPSSMLEFLPELKPHNEVRIRPRPGLRGWAIWAASLTLVLLFNGIVWIMVAT
jgi:hypothetical protein